VVTATSRVKVSGTDMTGAFKYGEATGPAHLSLADHGVNFACNSDAGVYLRLHQPVRTLDPLASFFIQQRPSRPPTRWHWSTR
jgi:hypothetical protein